MLVADTTSNSTALTPLNRTSVAPRKWVPVRVTRVPAGPVAGVKRVRVGGNTTVKGSALTAVPPGVTTLIGPLVAPEGTTASMLLPDTTSNSGALTPLNATAVASLRWVPVSVTRAPTGPRVGLNRVRVGGTTSKVLALATFEKTEDRTTLNARTRYS